MQSLNGAATILFPTEYQCPDEAAPGGGGADRLERDAFPATLAATRAPPTQTIAMAMANTSAVLDSLVLAGVGGFMVLPQWGHNPRHSVLFREMRSGATDGQRGTELILAWKGIPGMTTCGFLVLATANTQGK